MLASHSPTLFTNIRNGLAKTIWAFNSHSIESSRRSSLSIRRRRPNLTNVDLELCQCLIHWSLIYWKLKVTHENAY